MQKISLQDFEKAVNGINKKKFHIYRAIRFDEKTKQAYLSNWAIFRQNMSIEEYFSDKNLMILSSDKNNTLEDILKFKKKRGVKEYGFIMGIIHKIKTKFNANN